MFAFEVSIIPRQSSLILLPSSAHPFLLLPFYLLLSCSISYTQPPIPCNSPIFSSVPKTPKTAAINPQIMQKSPNLCLIPASKAQKSAFLRLKKYFLLDFKRLYLVNWWLNQAFWSSGENGGWCLHRSPWLIKPGWGWNWGFPDPAGAILMLLDKWKKQVKTR